MLACRIFGNRLAFHAEGPEMRWECEVGCGEGGGVKRYATAGEAAFFVALGPEPGVSWLVNRRLPRRAAVTAVVVATFAVITPSDAPPRCRRSG
jgi:hypothetical protein